MLFFFPLVTCVGAEVGLEVWALGVGLGAAGVFTAVDGRLFFPRSGSPATLGLHRTGGHLWSSQQGLLVKGQMTSGLVVGKVAEVAGVVVKVWHVGVVSWVWCHGLRRNEPGVMEGHHGRVLLRAVGVKVPWCDLTEASSAVPLHTSSLSVVKVIYIMYRVGEGSPTCLVIAINALVQLWLDCRGFSGRQELSHEAAVVDLLALLSWLVLKHDFFMVRSVLFELWQLLGVVVQRRVEFGRRAAPVGQQEVNVPRCLAVIIQELLCHLLRVPQLLWAAWWQFAACRFKRESSSVRLPHLGVREREDIIRLCCSRRVYSVMWTKKTYFFVLISDCCASTVLKDNLNRYTSVKSQKWDSV